MVVVNFKIVQYVFGGGGAHIKVNSKMLKEKSQKTHDTEKCLYLKKTNHVVKNNHHAYLIHSLLE